MSGNGWMEFLNSFLSLLLFFLSLVFLFILHILGLMFGFYIEVLNIVHLSSLDLVKSAPKQEGVVGILGSLLNKVFYTKWGAIKP